MDNFDAQGINVNPNNSSLANDGTVRETGVSSTKFDPSMYYDMSGQKYLFVFNHYEYKKSRAFSYKQPAPRNGTFKDEDALNIIFTKFGFKVSIHNDYTYEEIVHVIDKIRQDDHSDTSCLAFAILTHGDKGGQLYAADRKYLLTELMDLLQNAHPTLADKPKLFFIQACRGAQLDDGKTVYVDGDDDNILVIPSHVDFLILYSSVEEYVSWRDVNGSWMIQELCKVFRKYHQDLDILQMITLTNRNVAHERISTTRSRLTNKKKQTLETRFTLTKLLKLSINMD